LLDDNTGIDSLDLAALVVELQIVCDLDPFQDGFINFNTAGELAALCGSIAGGLNYMHVSNAYLSQPKYLDYGINVYGPMFGLNIKLGK
jgi:hypothetical protein